MDVNDLKNNPTAKKLTDRLDSTTQQLSSKVQGMYSEAENRRVVIRSAQGKELLALPLNIGVIGGAVAALAAPQLAAVAALGGFAAKLKIDVEHTGDRVVPGDLADPKPQHAAEDISTDVPGGHDAPTMFVDTTPVTPETTQAAQDAVASETVDGPADPYDPGYTGSADLGSDHQDDTYRPTDH